MEITSFLTVRVGSSRLPNKCMLPFGDCNVLEHVIRRAKASGLNPIVCTSVDPANDVIENIATQEGVRCFRGHEDDKLRRWLDCAHEFNVEAFHSVDVDDPFFDPEVMKYSFETLLEKNMDYIEPTKLSSSGNASVGYSISTEIVEKACALYDEGTDTELMWYYLETIENVKSEVLLDNDICSTVEARLTLDYEEDYWLLQSMCRILGNETTRQEVDAFLTKNPDFKEINWFRNGQWKANQLSKDPNAAQD